MLNMYIFIKSPAFSPPFKLFHDMASLFFILLSFLQWNLYTQYIFNQNIYRTKRFTILESRVICNLCNK